MSKSFSLNHNMTDSVFSNKAEFTITWDPSGLFAVDKQPIEFENATTDLIEALKELDAEH